MADGKVLLAGGWTYFSPVVSAEIFDPYSGTFVTIGSLNGARGYHTATLLADGRVLLAAGYDNSGSVATAEIFAWNTPEGGNVVVQPIDSTTNTTPVAVTFESVSQAGTTILTTSPDNSRMST